MTAAPSLAEDLVAALAELDNPHKDATADVGQYAYRYATLATLLDIARPVLGRHRLALLTLVESTGPTVTVRAVFHHATGDTLDVGRLDLARGTSAQQLGSAITYARRYLALAALGLAAEDDDGATAAQLVDTTPAPPPPDPDAVATFERLRTYGNHATAPDLLRELAADAGRRLTVDDLGAYPAWRAQVRELLDTLDLIATDNPAPDEEPATEPQDDPPAPRATVGSRSSRRNPPSAAEPATPGQD